MRILFVGPAGSIHAARWSSQLAETGWDVHFFASIPSAIRSDFQDMTMYGASARRPPGLDPNVRVRGFWPFRRGTWHAALPLRRFFAPALAGLIRRLRPDLVHSLGIQHGGYLTYDARTRLGGSLPPLIVSTWGSDIYYFGRLREHESRVRDVVEAADALHTDCERDMRLAREFGFSGEPFGVFPGGGGFPLDELERLRRPGAASARRLVVLKGQNDWTGRALVGLRALGLCADALQRYRIVIPFASENVKTAADLLVRKTGLSVNVESRWISHERMLALHGGARISIGLGISDGASVSMLEALAQGAFPIQSCTACADEWIDDGVNGSIVPPDDAEAVARAIRRALSDDELVDRAAERNATVAAERLDANVIRPRVIERYEEIAADVRASAPVLRD